MLNNILALLRLFVIIALHALVAIIHAVYFVFAAIISGLLWVEDQLDWIINCMVESNLNSQ